MKKNGFTLVELLGVIVILSLIMIVAIPAVTNSSKNVKKKLLETKMKNASQAAVLWAQDNRKCFVTDCTEFSCPNKNTNPISCTIKLSKLAADSYVKYDEGNDIKDPTNNKSILNSTITIKLDTSTKKITSDGYEVKE